MGDGFVVGQGRARTGQWAWFVLQGAQLTAVGAGLFAGQGSGLLLQQGLERTLGQAPGDGGGDLLQSGAIHVQAGTFLAEGTPRHDLTPLGSQVTEILEFLRC